MDRDWLIGDELLHRGQRGRDVERCGFAGDGARLGGSQGGQSKQDKWEARH
jgi:hypothetical protein